MKNPAEKGRANFLGAPPILILACGVSDNDRLSEASGQGSLRSQEVCPTLTQRFSLFQGVATPHEGFCGKDVSQQSG
jgi:hypothetical protein